MAESDAVRKADKKARSLALISGLAAFFFAVLMMGGVFALLSHPASPLPQEWNPTRPLAVSDPVTPLTSWKLARTIGDEAQCRAVLADAVEVTFLPPRQDSDVCHIGNRVTLTGVGRSAIAALETSCGAALRMAMWERHGVQPAAAEILGQDVSAIAHIGSYNCRQMRTASGLSQRMSTHATAGAVDVTGFRLGDGRQLTLLSDWDGDTDTSAFLRRVRDGACDWFGLVLSPDFNRLHADHFHLQARGWGGCR